MKHTIRHSCHIAALMTAITLNMQGANPPPGYIDFGKFPQTSGEFVEVDLKNSLLSMVARLTQKEEPEVAELLRGVHSIRVNVIGLTDENREDMETRIKSIRTELDTKGWEKIVTAQNPKEDVGIYLKTRAEEAIEGLVLTVLEGKREAVLINIVGDIKLDKLGALGDRLNIAPLKKVAQALEQKPAPPK
jgi:hypothetical protein